MPFFSDMLDRRVDLVRRNSRKDLTIDPSGGLVESWETVHAGIPCSIQPVGSSRRNDAGRQTHEYGAVTVFTDVDLRAYRLTVDHYLVWRAAAAGNPTGRDIVLRYVGSTQTVEQGELFVINCEEFSR